jgi:chromosome segregation ATPase
MNIQRNLAELGDRIGKAREDLRIVEEQILFQADVVEEAKTRMLVSETPLADREFRVARDDFERLESQRQEVAGRIAELQREQDRLLDRMLGTAEAPTGAGPQA